MSSVKDYGAIMYKDAFLNWIDGVITRKEFDARIEHVWIEVQTLPKGTIDIDDVYRQAPELFSQNLAQNHTWFKIVKHAEKKKPLFCC